MIDVYHLRQQDSHETFFYSLVRQPRGDQSRMTKSEVLVCRWTGGDAVGYSDLILLSKLREGERDGRFVHLVRGPRDWMGSATCRLTVTAKVADLNYNLFPAENTLAGMQLGVMRFLFVDKDRSQLPMIQWSNGKNGHFRRAPVSVTVEKAIELPTYKPKAGLGRRTLREITERPGQARFRATLMLVYSGQCCISSCTVAEALDGAHIDPYQNPTQDSPHNGFLLRRDIHALFDANLLTISPSTGKVVVARALRKSKEYAPFHGRPINAPTEGFAAAAPDRLALDRRFNVFEE